MSFGSLSGMIYDIQNVTIPKTSERGQGPVHSVEIQDLTRRFDRLTLATMAMWELIRDQTELTEEDLIAKIQEIDLRDGSENGKLVVGVKTCTACNRPVNPRHKNCLYCGAKLEKESAFDGAL